MLSKRKILFYLGFISLSISIIAVGLSINNARNFSKVYFENYQTKEDIKFEDFEKITEKQEELSNVNDSDKIKQEIKDEVKIKESETLPINSENVNNKNEVKKDLESKKNLEKKEKEVEKKEKSTSESLSSKIKKNTNNSCLKYRMQVGAFKESLLADKYKIKLESKGYKVLLKKKGKLNFVYILNNSKEKLESIAKKENIKPFLIGNNK